MEFFDKSLSIIWFVSAYISITFSTLEMTRELLSWTTGEDGKGKLHLQVKDKVTRTDK